MSTITKTRGCLDNFTNRYGGIDDSDTDGYHLFPGHEVYDPNCCDCVDDRGTLYVGKGGPAVIGPPGDTYEITERNI